MSPSEYQSKKPPYQIEVVHYRNLASLSISAVGDTWAMMTGSRGTLWIYRDNKQILQVPIAPSAQDCKVGYHFTISPDFAAEAEFRFSFGRHRGQIMLGDWIETAPRFESSLELSNATIPQGGTLRGEFKLVCSSKYYLQFGSDCQWNYEIANASGEVVLRSEKFCGETLTQIKLDPGVTASIPIVIATQVNPPADLSGSHNGLLPPGEYTLTVYVEEHRDMHLEAVAKITVSP